MVFRNMMIEVIPGEKCFIAVFAAVRQGSWEMNILYMFLEVAPISSCLAAEGAFKTFWSQRWLFNQVGREDNTSSTC